MLVYPRIGVTVKSGLEEKSHAIAEILAILRSINAQIFFDAERKNDIPETANLPSYTSAGDIDLLLVIGGDGTILRTVRELKDLSIPIVSVNRGTVGFLAEIELHEAAKILPSLLSGSGVIEERSILSIEALRGQEKVFTGYALNEAVIAQGTIARLVDLHTKVKGENLTTFHADGLIISTPTGSTAYSLAAGGPIVHPKLAATILTPINPHSFSQKPVVIPSEYEVEITVASKTNKFQDVQVILTIDGQVYVPLQSGDTVTACGCGKTVRFLRRKQDTFFGTLREKLKWGE
ncbi:MAG: NAD+ kinase [Candidatus Peregrinibacteria bacterium Greene0416_62]|nr:MAG: NAD+ kinase [Candidatus Peregrinibacteria bacterium Greene0416_62]